MTSTASPTLLYIDDDAGLARLVERGLKRQGYLVEHCENGEAGIARIEQGGVDVIALDQYMPGMDGLEVLELIQKLPAPPPVVFVTASQDSKIAVTALKAGAADYLVKDTSGDFIPLLTVACDTAIKQAAIMRARDEAEAEVHAARDRYAALAAEREVLLREVNHRVGNSLQIIASLLHLQASSAREDDVKAALTNAMGRVAAVAQVHRRLYTSHDLKSVLLNQYLEALLEDLRRSAEGNRMSRLTLKAKTIEIDPDRAVAIGIIVNELVMNAVKYAYPDGAGPIHVELDGHGHDLELSITDDGVGLNVKADPRSTGMGQRIVSAMANKLDATVERDPNHTGTRITLRFSAVTKTAPKLAVTAAK
ncbi:MAG: two-component system sensor histidine kinase/response regulator [Bradyrhizobiaceae bacterium PARB1]|jgi:two-component sensor histidine kinase|nr:MAG: two-component system sensor histidine kinase/response regulator [Bradyrhizobiaceae bacterium PARB1]